MKPYTPIWWFVAALGQVYKTVRDPRNARIYALALIGRLP